MEGVAGDGGPFFLAGFRSWLTENQPFPVKSDRDVASSGRRHGQAGSRNIAGNRVDRRVVRRAGSRRDQGRAG
jgi:hypothetical protein